jgi:hypothetical protein
MPTWNRRRITQAAGAVLVLAGALVTVVLLTEDPEPEFDENLWQAVAPVVHADLPANRKVTWAVSPGERWFCAERPVETRRDGGDVRVGLIARCDAYVRQDSALVQSGGMSDALVVVLTPGPDGYRVREVEVPSDGAGHDASLRRMFSAAGYEKVRDSASQAGPDPAPEARAAFGLPADTPVQRRRPGK